MEALVTTADGEGQQTYIGVTVCEGPGRYRLLLTQPYHEAGRIVEIPRSNIQTVESVEGR